MPRAKPQEPQVDQPGELKVLKFDILQRGEPCLIRLPGRADTMDFAIQARAIRQYCQSFNIEPYFFDETQDYEKLVSDEKFFVRLGLMKAPLR